MRGVPRRAAAQRKLLRALRRTLANAGAAVRALPQASPPWDVAWVPLRYGWPLDVLEARFKFGGDLAAGRALAAQWLAQAPPSALPAALIPVPLQIPVHTRTLRRTRATTAQTELDRVARRRNVRGAFALAAG